MQEKNSHKKGLVLLVSTGLGRIKRGYENHISMMGDAMLAEAYLPFRLDVIGGRKIDGKSYRKVPSVSRNNWLLLKAGLSWKRRFQIEQATFLAGLIPFLLIKKPTVIYLAEYELYCWLFKIRKYLGLSFGLILYTGGMAVPGLFDPAKDMVHHVTDALVATALKMGIPEDRQVLIPHFVRHRFYYDDRLINKIRTAASGKKVVLVAGAMNTDHKRMDVAARILGSMASKIYPVFTGDATEESPVIEAELQKYFGTEYMLTSCTPEDMGSFYAAADVFFSASAYESFGLVYIEALWHGLPMLCHQHATLEKVTAAWATGSNMNDIKVATGELQFFLEALPLYANCSLEKHLFAEKNYGWKMFGSKYINFLEKQAFL